MGRGTGRVAFETRNRLARAWETWDTEDHLAVGGPGGSPVRMTRRITAPVDGRTLSVSHTFSSDAWERPRVSHGTLRFLDEADLDSALARAGLVVAARFGAWEVSPLTAASPEIISIARPYG